jgi:thiol-disulfide isomerase/thioredoxin
MMTSPSLILGLLWLMVGPAAAASLTLDTLRVGSRVYSNVTVLGANATDLYFMHANGIANAKLKYLSPDLQTQFKFDPKAAAEAEVQQAKDEALYENSLASNIVARVEKANHASRKAASTSDDSLADPISDKSLLGKAAPPLHVEKWLGEKPALDGKFTLITFWAPWSIPCRKVIPELNALQKKFPEKLVILGLTSEPEEDVNAMTEPKLEFASAIDTKARLSTAVGVSSVPSVLLLDPNNIIRYIGHPGALDPKKLEALLTRGGEESPATR